MCLSGQIGKCRKDRVNRNLHLARASALQLVTVQTGNDVREGLKKNNGKFQNVDGWGQQRTDFHFFVVEKKTHKLKSLGIVLNAFQNKLVLFNF